MATCVDGFSCVGAAAVPLDGIYGVLNVKENSMIEEQVAHPAIATEAEWLTKRKELLLQEKELTRHADRISAERRRLPMVRIEKTYEFDGPNGKRSLLELFDGRLQLIVYHFMF